MTNLSLRALLRLDAAACALMGVALALGAGPIGVLTDLPPALLLGAGLALVPIAAFIALVATLPAVSPAAVRLIVAGNVVWVLGSFGLLLSGLIAPNLLGKAFVTAQAAAVAALAGLEHSALRSAARVA